MENLIETKVCTKCGVEKELLDFRLKKCRNGVYGIITTCKDCEKISSKEYRERPGMKSVLKTRAHEFYQKPEVKIRYREAYKILDRTTPAYKERKRKINMKHYQKPGIKERLAEREKERLKDPEYKKHKRDYSYKYHQSRRDNLSESYVTKLLANNLKSTLKQIREYPELIQLETNLLTLKRQLKNGNKRKKEFSAIG